MTTSEMITSFGLNYASEINTSVPGWETSEILAFLNRSQREIARESAAAGQYDRIHELLTAYEASYPLTLTDFSSPAPVNLRGDISNAMGFYQSDMSDEGMLQYVESSTKLSRTNPTMTNEYISNILIPESLADKFAYNGTNRPWFKHPRVFLTSHANPMIVVIYDSYTAVSSLRVQFIRNPAEITLSADCELNVNLHDSVVNRAVTIAIETLQNPRIQTQPIISR